MHAVYIADAICFAHLQGKLNQGLGVYEVIDLALNIGVLDMSAKPQLVDEGPAWAVVDGQRSSGYYTLNVMADIAIEKAKTSGIAIVYGGNHNDFSYGRRHAWHEVFPLNAVVFTRQVQPPTFWRKYLKFVI